jgi:hypothetical protein
MDAAGTTDRAANCWGIALLSASLLATFAGAPAAPTSASTPVAPATQPASAPADGYFLRVTADSVNLRSRGDANSTIVARVPRDTILRGFGQSYGWHRVLPPEGSCSYAAAAYIERRSETEGMVVVQSGTLRVRVGSTARELDPQESEVQVLLERGAPVHILGTQGQWLKIAPPPGVYFYVSAEHVTPVTVAAASQLPAARVIPGAAPPRAAASAPVASAPAATTRPAAHPDLSGAWGQRLVLIEAALEAEARRPPLEADWAALLARLRPVAQQREEPMVARLAAAWMDQVQQRIADQDAARAADEVVQRAARERAAHEREMGQIERLATRPASGPAWVAQGELLQSIARPQPPGRAAYKLQDPFTRRVVVYLEIDRALHLTVERLLGQYVGVRGERRADAELGADLVRVSEIVALGPPPPAAPVPPPTTAPASTQPARP